MPGGGRLQRVEQLVSKGLGESQGQLGTGAAGMEQSPLEKYLGGKHIRIWWPPVRIREREESTGERHLRKGGRVEGRSVDPVRVSLWDRSRATWNSGAWT